MNERSTATPPATSPSAKAPAVRKPAGQRWPQIWGPRLWMLLAFAVVLLIYRVWLIGHSGISLFFDEAQYWDWSRHLAWGYYSKPPMIAGLIWLSTKLFGSGVVGVKLMTMLLYPVTAVVMVGFARALWPTSSGVRTGTVAGALFLTLPMVGALGLFASTDAPLLLCWTVAGWMLWRAQVTNRMAYWVGVGLACGLGLMSKYTMAAFALTALWTLWAVHGPRRGLMRPGPWVAIALALLILSPNLWWNAHHGFPTLQHTAELTTKSGRNGGLLSALEFAGGQLLMLGPVVVVAGLWLAWRQRRALVGETPVAPRSQWANSSQVMPPSPWAHSTLGSAHSAAGTQTRPVARTSAYYLASVSSRRYLWAMSLPLLLLALGQALYADANLNWAAPGMIGLTLLLATLLSPPLVPLAAPRPHRWLVIMLGGNLLLTGLVMHARDFSTAPLPHQFDAMWRMRGWQEAFADLAPALDDPVVAGLPVLADQRVLITQAAYNWRSHGVKTLFWNPKGTRNNHYELTQSLPDRVGPDVLLISHSPQPDAITQRFAIVRHLKSTVVPVSSDRKIELHLFFLRGFLGYTPQSYTEQSGTQQDSRSAPLLTP
ncbi:glycosyltransferase family 39 protein [Aquabacterium sp.]|jgi:4-amino-4-deoxy-L-arabinose transferase-like glycosyltransferase|uniref:ArnT family glycosyltransferase n=1 Tax=Aquabacterium sp. TaxID=1872578 RepID=UPI001E13A5A7|nr:glycosyltransferase family 39 protein [Aquabacterium sp.]MBT9610894.1 glycosyltransferase family 39 protein [Aquabacterium sp.]